MFDRRWGTFAAGALSTVLALAMTATGVAAGDGRRQPAGSTENAWGWVVARQPTAAGYVPGARDQGNSTGGQNRVERLGTGSYLVVFAGIDNGRYPVGTVTALSSGSRSCMFDDNARGPDPGASSVYVDCFDRSGAPAAARFSVNVMAPGDGGGNGTLGFTWADQETTAFYSGPPAYTFNSSGPFGVEIRRNAAGSYRVGVPRLARPGGNAQVVAAKGGPAALCRVLTLVDAQDAELIEARCRDVAGTLVDADFMIVYADAVGMTGTIGRPAAYLLANRPAAAAYRPRARYRFSSAGEAPTVRRSSVGRYRVTLPGMPKGGSAQVTAYGPGGSICQLTGIRTKGLPQRIGVACFGHGGAAKDSRFMLTYTR